jgi:hypothetical protein
MGQYASQSDRPGKDEVAAGDIKKGSSKVNSALRDQRRGGVVIDLKATKIEESINEEQEHKEMATSPMAGEGNAGDFVKADIADMPEEENGSRACPVCTLLNDSNAVVCDCCGTVL